MLLVTLVASLSQAIPQDISRIDANTPVALQVALAESAGPPVAGDAAVYVLGPSGYVRVRESKNGFTCLVSRERVDTLEPECFDAEGSRTTVPVRLFIEAERARGVPEETIRQAVAEGYRSERFRAPQKPGIVYMLSAHNHVFDPGEKRVIHFPGHLMFYAPYATAKDVGEGPGAPYIVAPGTPHALLVVVPAAHGEHR